MLTFNECTFTSNSGKFARLFYLDSNTIKKLTIFGCVIEEGE